MKKKMGRPPTADYTKKIMRFSAIEKEFIQIMSELNTREKKVAEKVLEEFKKRII